MDDREDEMKKNQTLQVFLLLVMGILYSQDKKIDIPKVEIVFTIPVNGEGGIPYQPANDEDSHHPRVCKVMADGNFCIGSPDGLFVYNRKGEKLFYYNRPQIGRILGNERLLVRGASSPSEPNCGILVKKDTGYYYHSINLAEDKYPKIYREGLFFIETKNNPDIISDVLYFSGNDVKVESLKEWLPKQNGNMYLKNGILYSNKTGPIFSTSSFYKPANYQNPKNRFDNGGDFFDIDAQNNYYFLTQDKKYIPAITIRKKDMNTLRYFSLKNQVTVSNGIDFPSLDEKGNIYFLVPSKKGHKVYMIKNDWGEEVLKLK
jgi:hypothetical protein